MPYKVGNGGYSKEKYDEGTGKYIIDGIPNKSYENKKEEKIISENQKNFFNESKMRDENGNLRKFYHGTSDGTFSKFKPGSYFTENKEYADTYQSPYASSIGANHRKKVENPTTHEVYLNFKKPFDIINDEEARKIYINDFIKGGWSNSISPYESDDFYNNIKDVDWTEGENLFEFLMENQDYGYDSMVFDEGGIPSQDGDVISRGRSYVNFFPNQVKRIDNLNPTDSDDMYDLENNEKIKAEKLYGMKFK